MDERRRMLETWLLQDLSLPLRGLTPVSADASFRRYFRVHLDQGSYIVMDAPPDKEDCRPFVRLAGAFAARGMNVPRVFEADLARGFLLLSDFGDRQYLAVLDDASAARLYGDALAALVRLQTGTESCGLGLPPYDEARLRQEMALFRDWYVGRHLGVVLTPSQVQAWEESCVRLVDSVLAQPQVWVHRDYHSRNLMVLDADNPGVLDFQDAVEGPVTYDVVSLLRDCYIRWPEARVRDWLDQYHRQARRAGLLVDVTPALLRRWFDWMGVQRHLKAVGIFARLRHRDGKSRYLADIPRTLGYLETVCGRYEDLAPLSHLLQSLPRPAGGEPGGGNGIRI